MNSATGADLVCDALLRERVSVLFGHPGGAILPFYDALHRRSAELRHVLCRHEQGAAHAADGYARASGEVGVCVATSGPGATNLVTGLATALMDSVPMVAITGQVPRGVLGTFAFQETDILGVTTSVTKHGFLVRDAADVPAVVEEAFRIARSGRPGPVVVDLPKDVQAERTERLDWPARVLDGSARDGSARDGSARDGSALDGSALEGSGAAIARAAAWLERAERPVVLAGRGVVVARQERTLARFVELADLPVTTSLLGLDAFPASDGRSLGMPGMHGTERANRAIQAADLIVGLGVRFDDRIIGRPDGFAPDARIVHFDIDPTAIGRTVRVDLAVVADLADSLPTLLASLQDQHRHGWWERIRRWERDAAPPSDPALQTGPLGARAAVRAVARRVSGGGGIVASDVGQHQMWLAQELGDLEARSHLTSGGLGTMGYALPAAIGAAVARPNRPVWAVAGDGGFQMNLQELATVAQEQIPLRIAVIDNGYLGMVRQWQERFYEGRYSASRISGPDLVGLGAAYGIRALQVDRAENLEATLDRAVATGGPVLIAMRVDPEENVYPMVPTGAALHEMVMAPEAVAG
jgi:acetolactate synthase-1/2/3 large subunit